MRRLIKTFTVKRHVQFIVEQDGEAKTFVVLRLDAGARQVVEVPEQRFGYENDRASIDQARSRAVGAARQLAAEAGQRLAVEGEAEEQLSPEAEAECDERAAARAQSMSPEAQEAAGRRR
jgi:uncharacterized protein YggE